MEQANNLKYFVLYTLFMQTLWVKIQSQYTVISKHGNVNVKLLVQVFYLSSKLVSFPKLMSDGDINMSTEMHNICVLITVDKNCSWPIKMNKWLMIIFFHFHPLFVYDVAVNTFCCQLNLRAQKAFSTRCFFIFVCQKYKNKSLLLRMAVRRLNSNVAPVVLLAWITAKQIDLTASYCTHTSS